VIALKSLSNGPGVGELDGLPAEVGRHFLNVFEGVFGMVKVLVVDIDMSDYQTLESQGVLELSGCSPGLSLVVAWLWSSIPATFCLVIFGSDAQAQTRTTARPSQRDVASVRKTAAEDKRRDKKSEV
jgi:hypothetical protein